MNTFFLFFLPLTWALAKESKALEPFEMHRAVNKTAFFIGLAANGDEIIATIPQEYPPFETSFQGLEILFVSKDKAYSFRPYTGELVEYNGQIGSLKPTVVLSGDKDCMIALGNDKRVFVWCQKGNRETGYKSIISTYKDRALEASPDDKIYGIISYFTESYLNELVEISLYDKKKNPKVLAKAHNNTSVTHTVKCDKKGDIYVNWKTDVIEVYNSQGKTASITSDFNVDHMAISNSVPYYLYAAGYRFAKPENTLAIGRVGLEGLI
ncbi:hypothetical protein DSO57_1024262 [Entomophthora muscae]|uniref:Uncharacterized protein n=1 Tax=Entomophthora muscae TaxID=34485 RepID=A0ACC2S4G6_9FUNG|nr:hypothetical protein DSO57_1024262 [Entomophthora muscae]